MANESINFDRAAEFYDSTRGFPPGEDVAAAALIAQTGGLTNQSRVLEIGVGTGRIGVPLSAHSGHYTGFDISAAMMGKIASKAGGERVHLTQADATRLPFADATFDVAVSVHIFHLIPNWQQALRETARVLKLEGVLLNCFNHPAGESADHLKQMRAIWREALQGQKSHELVGVPLSKRETFLVDSGWQQVGERQSHRYQIIETVADELDRKRRRVSSSTWQVDDAVYARGIAALEAYVAEHVDDVNQPYPLDDQFSVEVYKPG